MFKASSVLKAGVACVALSGLALGGSVAAHADPASFKTYAAVGSDTTQDVWNALATSPITSVGSYDAFPSPSNIQTKAAGHTFARPSGSGNGVKALSAAWDPANHVWSGTTLSNVDVDFARSSGRPATPTAGGALTYLPFARDAVSVAVKGTSITNFSTAQLAAIYGGADDNSAGTGITYDSTTGLPKLGDQVLHPVLPQASSGTRSFFQGAIGITTPNLGSYVEPAASTLAENDGRVLTETGSLIPFSAAQWIAQNKGLTTNTTAGVTLKSIDGVAPVAGTGTASAPGALYGATNTTGEYSAVPGVATKGTYNRDVYNVIPTSFFDGTDAQLDLVDILTTANPGAVGSSEAETVIHNYGFGTLSYLGDTADYLGAAFSH